MGSSVGRRHHLLRVTLRVLRGGQNISELTAKQPFLPCGGLGVNPRLGVARIADCGLCGSA